MAFREPFQFSSLTLNGLRLQVRLGCLQDERDIPQYVRFDLRIRFASPPQACLSDKLEETVCYADLSKTIESVCDREYRLIESLGWTAFQALKKTLPDSSQLAICLTKEKPPVPHLRDGASFYLGDWDQAWPQERGERN